MHQNGNVKFIQSLSCLVESNWKRQDGLYGGTELVAATNGDDGIDDNGDMSVPAPSPFRIVCTSRVNMSFVSVSSSTFTWTNNRSEESGCRDHA
mmetsp:Transcript_19666/g.54695  ORF Transcript_19666/g.54695 Transcript_19666/m.54695 type:complete len:94 (+) Transcript_19666:628-909(+)